MRFTRWASVAAIAVPLLASVPPADLVPARWNWTDPQSLDLLAGTPINCLLLKAHDAAFAEQAGKRGLVPLAVITPGGDAAETARQAIRNRFQGIVLEGDFPDGTASRVRDALADSKVLIIELTARSRMKLGGPDPILGTYQGVWPGIEVTENGGTKAGPSGSPWIDTNTGFIRSARAWGNATIWIGNLPPPHTVLGGEAYLQALCDAAMAGARWILALDDNFAARLRKSDPGAVRDWKRITQYLRYYEDHKEWRTLGSYSKLAIVQDPSDGALLSGGIVDMIAARHTPVRPVPRQRLTPDALKGASMAVDVDPAVLTPEEREVLKQYTRAGGTLLTAPDGWKMPAGSNQITLDEAALKHLNDIYHDVQNMIGRRNLGARLFNASSMLSNLTATADGKAVVIQLVNYSSYPVESVAVHFLGEYHHARLYTPEGGEREVEIYKTEEGSGVDLDRIAVCATLRLE